MLLTEKAAYIKGLAEGMDLDANDKTVKLIKALIDVIDDLTLSVADLEDEVAELHEQLDAVDEDLAAVEDFLDDEDDEEYYDDDEEFFEVQCPECDEVITLDEDMLAEGEIECPKCGTKLEFEFDTDEEEVAHEEAPAEDEKSDEQE